MLNNGLPKNGATIGRLNSVQRTMLDWNDAHPYNAVHVVRIPALFDLQRLRSNIEHALEYRGLSGLTLDRNKGTYHYGGGPAECEIEIVAAGADRQSTLTGEIERQLNTPFAPGKAFNPYRFFVLPEPEGFSLGLTYFHAVADAESFVLLLKEVVQTYLHVRNGAPAPQANVYPLCYDNLLRHQPGPLARKLSAIPRLVKSMRISSRPPYRNGQPTTSGFMMCSLGPKDFRHLTGTAKSWGITTNDLLLGLLMKSLGELAADRRLALRRRNISVGCIVNTRKDFGLDGQGMFGLFLGSFVVTHEVPEKMSLRDLTADIHRQTSAIKRHKLYLGAPLELAAARLMLSLFSAERGKKFYHRYYPLWGGLTNVNLNVLWNQNGCGHPIDYLRAVSTSPATPLVLSATTVGETMNIGFTYRSTAFLSTEMEQVKEHFLMQAASAEAGA